MARSPEELLIQIGAILATGNRVFTETDNPALSTLTGLPQAVAIHISRAKSLEAAEGLCAVLADCADTALIALGHRLAAMPGPIIALQSVPPEARSAGADYRLERLLEEVSISTNTAAAGGNASLMTIG
jgi:RHH-type proline utilization regulon transcriptional repressor/proline dehydrogenase/delta 1-pyrroline-5-carboxylate dehydrogenase